MCLGVVGTVTEIWDEGGVPMGTVDDGREQTAVCLLYVPEVEPGDAVLVHLGFAVERLDPDRAEEATALRQEFG
jgi:hydrogenase expression/formation protein HypC